MRAAFEPTVRFRRRSRSPWPPRPPWHPAQEHPPAAEELLQILRPLLHGHASGDLAHGRKQRQLARGELNRLVRDGDRARVEHRAVSASEAAKWKYVKMTCPSLMRGDSSSIGLLHLEHRLGASPNLLTLFRDGGARRS